MFRWAWHLDRSNMHTTCCILHICCTGLLACQPPKVSQACCGGKAFSQMLRRQQDQKWHLLVFRWVQQHHDCNDGQQLFQTQPGKADMRICTGVTTRIGRSCSAVFKIINTCTVCLHLVQFIAWQVPKATCHMEKAVWEWGLAHTLSQRPTCTCPRMIKCLVSHSMGQQTGFQTMC